MGSDLYKSGNHNIKFKGKNFIELSQEIKATLESNVFPNAEFLRLQALHSANGDERDVRKIREIKTKKDWTFQEETDYYNFENNRYIDFEGPFNLQITFYENKITFWNPEYSYQHWIEMDDDTHRDEWRKYMHQIVRLFGGDRVIYLANN